MSKDLRDMLDDIESSEKETAVLQSKLDRFKELAERQKRIISNQETLIEEQKEKISKMYDIPEDILELKEIIGEQRQLLTEREVQLEHSKGEVAQAKRELELVQTQILPTQHKLEETYETIGNLRTELAEKNSEIILKNEKITNLENRIQELQAFTDKFKEEQLEMIKEMEEKHRKETQELKNEISKLDSFLLDSKLISTEKSSEAKDMASRFEQVREKYDALINKVEKLNDKNREANAEILKLKSIIEDTQNAEETSLHKIKYYDKLKPLMEKEPIFRTFLIIDKVGSILLEDLRKALGSPIVTVKKNVQQLQDIGLLEIDDFGKISVKKVDEL
ncbi:MAG: hypothetical protein ACFE8L_05840 [Candidatus Hodarchaeota archaeon]